MALKWALVAFALVALGLVVLSKALSFLSPPRPGRPEPPALGRLRRALYWWVLVPALVGLLLLLATLSVP